MNIPDSQFLRELVTRVQDVWDAFRRNERILKIADKLETIERYTVMSEDLTDIEKATVKRLASNLADRMSESTD